MNCDQCGNMLLEQELFNRGSLCVNCQAQRVSPAAAVTSINDADNDNDAAPAYWNPDVAAGLSLILSPIFGAIILALNWHKLGERDNALRSWLISLATFMVIISSSFIVQDKFDVSVFNKLLPLLQLVLCSIWYFASARHQTRYIHQKLGKNFNRASWIEPICFVVILWGSMALIG